MRCSRKCARPDLPGVSSAEPTWYQIMWVTTRAPVRNHDHMQPVCELELADLHALGRVFAAAGKRTAAEPAAAQTAITVMRTLRTLLATPSGAVANTRRSERAAARLLARHRARVVRHVRMHEAPVVLALVFADKAVGSVLRRRQIAAGGWVSDWRSGSPSNLSGCSCSRPIMGSIFVTVGTLSSWTVDCASLAVWSVPELLFVFPLTLRSSLGVSLRPL